MKSQTAQVYICKMTDYHRTPLCQKHAMQSLWANALLRKICLDCLGKSAEEVRLHQNSNGKWEGCGAYFSVTHSGSYVAVATSSTPIGIDLQKCTNADMRNVARRFFTQREFSAWEQSPNQTDEFFFVWCKKEALWKSLDVQPPTTSVVETSDAPFLLQKLVLDGETYYLAVTQNAEITFLQNFNVNKTVE
ncbi:MAG: 4'-phosphopantetheinyl transferase family protein [Candidatus Fimimonas sp.]